MRAAWQKPGIGARINWGHPLARGLAGCWLMNEGSGDRVHDLTGNGNYGTLTNMTAADWTVTEMGEAVDLPGADDVIQVASSDSLLMTEAITVAVHSYLWSGAANETVFAAKAVSAFIWHLARDKGNNAINWRVQNDVAGGSGLLAGLDNTWVWAIGRFVPGTPSASVIDADGVMQTRTTSGPAAIPTNADVITLGNRVGMTQSLQAPIAQAMIWARYVSDDALLDLARAPFAFVRWPWDPLLWYTNAAGVGAQTAYPGFISRAAAAFDPTASPGAVTASPGMVARAAAAFDPTAVPGAVQGTAEMIARAALAFDPIGSPGVVGAAPEFVARSAQGFDPTGVPGSAEASPGFVARSADAFAPTGVPGAIAGSVEFAPRAAQGFNPTGMPGTAVASPEFIARSAQAFAVVASGGSITALPELAARTAQAFDAQGVGGAVQATAEFIARPAQAFDADRLAVTVVLPEAVLRSALAFDPTTSVGPVTVNAEFADRTATAWSVVGRLEGELAPGYYYMLIMANRRGRN